ncbi:hypothetical protein PV08_03211 [Exophiala spinifera]|uniref:Major facilitator superfamily (MFS) profile domain-containing protein n=1 Tax=Exophiala spinifera TaxID=91928 RepID=A0A0D2A1V7_9EURO|nr:uncharacterized protein PV08_03211 [Exophiala spinifera]KIW18922.1 hypothetical protein PV08_03211 [Exophiala spinifera]
MRYLEWFSPGRATRTAVAVTCGQAFFLFGYDQGVFGGLITNPDFLNIFGHPAPGLMGIIVSIYNLGCLFGCILNFFVADPIGRRKAILVAMFFISVGAVIQCSSYSRAQLMVGRFITGLGVGIDSSTVPMYQVELCKGDNRGRLVSTEVIFIALGISFAYFFDFGLSYGSGPFVWRFPIAFQIVLALPIAAIILALPETPRWLVQQGNLDEARSVIQRVYGLSETAAQVDGQLKEIVDAVELERSTEFKWSAIFRRGDPLQTGYRVFLACLILLMNQWSGINVVVFYAAVILEDSVGLEHKTAIVTAGCVNLAFAAGCIGPILGLDKIGRRPLLMIGTAGQAVSMALIAALLSFKGTNKEHATATASVAFFITYMLSFGSSLFPIPWLYAAEILPLQVRAKGTALAVMNNWVWVFTIVMITPTLVHNIQWKTYLVFMSTNFAFLPLIYFLFPETKGLTLEEIDYIFLKRDRLQDDHSDNQSPGDLTQQEEKKAEYVENVVASET